MGIGNGSQTKTLISDPQTWSPEDWYHIAVTYYNDTENNVGIARIFLNGVEVARGEYAEFGTLTSGTKYWNVGNRGGSSYAPRYGYYDNFRVSSVAYDYAVPVPEPGVGLLLLGAIPMMWAKRKAKKALKRG